MEKFPIDKNVFTLQELAPPVDSGLLRKIETYFYLLDHPDSDVSSEESEVVAGQYMAQHITGQYSDLQIQTCLWMSR